MTRRLVPWSLALAIGLGLGASSALGQSATLPDTTPAGAPGGNNSSLGPSPGSGAGGFSQLPGSGDNPIGGRPGTSTSRAPSSVSNPNAGNMAAPVSRGTITNPASTPAAEIPGGGTLDFQGVSDDEGPPEGLSLDQAIERLVRDNLTLRGLAFELPQAEADILTASLRNNPVFYADSQLIPYGQYTRARPGGQTQYDINISYPLDLSHKRQARTRSATLAYRVLQEQYRDAVRTQIDNLYTVYVDVLAARATLRYSSKSVEGLKSMGVLALERQVRGQDSEVTYTRVLIQIELAEQGRMDATEALRKAKRSMANLLNVPPSQVDELEIRGPLKDLAPPAPPEETLQEIAYENRPDLIGYRLGIARAEADVKLQQANKYQDVYVLAQPYTFQDNSPNGLRSPTSWALGVTIPIPIYNKNQGNIRRARLNVTQTQTQLTGTLRQVITDVQLAEREYLVTRNIVERNDKTLRPTAERLLEIAQARLKEGEENMIYFLTARSEYATVVKQYLDSLVRHRRAMLDLNTAVGRRILP